MPGGGSKPGERRGGRQKGVLNKRTAALEQRVIMELPSHVVNNPELAIEKIRKGMNICEGVAAFFQPTPPAEIAQGATPNPNADWDKFAEWLDRQLKFASVIIDRETPKLQALAILPPPIVEDEKPKQARPFTLTVFEGGMGLQKKEEKIVTVEPED
jgi:hypothetical protein